MTFGQKVKQLRAKSGLTQEELGKKMGITNRAVTSYETDKSRPRGIEAYRKLAKALDADVNYLLNEDEEFVEIAHSKYGNRGSKQALALVDQIGGMFAGGELSQEDMDAVMKSMQKLYWDAKEENQKYVPKKYRRDE